jgi:hypothetical protein
MSRRKHGMPPDDTKTFIEEIGFLIDVMEDILQQAPDLTPAEFSVALRNNPDVKEYLHDIFDPTRVPEEFMTARRKKRSRAQPQTQLQTLVESPEITIVHPEIIRAFSAQSPRGILPHGIPKPKVPPLYPVEWSPKQKLPSDFFSKSESTLSPEAALMAHHPEQYPDNDIHNLEDAQERFLELVLLEQVERGSIYPGSKMRSSVTGQMESIFNPIKKALNDRRNALWEIWGPETADALHRFNQQLALSEGSGYLGRCDFLSGNVCEMKQGDGCCGMGYMGRMRQDRSF